MPQILVPRVKPVDFISMSELAAFRLISSHFVYEMYYIFFSFSFVSSCCQVLCSLSVLSILLCLRTLRKLSNNDNYNNNIQIAYIGLRKTLFLSCLLNDDMNFSKAGFLIRLHSRLHQLLRIYIHTTYLLTYGPICQSCQLFTVLIFHRSLQGKQFAPNKKKFFDFQLLESHIENAGAIQMFKIIKPITKNINIHVVTFITQSSSGFDKKKIAVKRILTRKDAFRPAFMRR